MKHFLSILVLCPVLLAQEPTKSAAEAAKAQEPAQKEAEKKEAESPKAESQETKVEPAEAKSSPEKLFHGDFEIGVRWNHGVAGNLETYRSVVNLGEGVRILSWDTRVDGASFKYLKNLQFRGAGWGGDPSSWMQLRAEEQRYYRLNVDHRSTAYFSALPSFANPLVERGLFASQRSFDTQRRFTEVQLDLRPASLIIPYVGYMRDSGVGRGVTTFVSDLNEYPVLNLLDDRTNLFRSGVRAETRRFHALVEGGGIWFDDDQRLVSNDRNSGNLTRPFFGQSLFLDSVLQTYRVDGTSFFTKGALSAQPFTWMDLTGAFQFSQPKNTTQYDQQNRGSFVDLDTFTFFNNQNVRLLTAADQPHVTANAGMELQPVSRVRILQSWMTDRLHNAGSTGDRLEWNYSQQQSEALFDATRFLTLRGGYRYVWGDGLARASFLASSPLERGELKRHAALTGFVLRFGHPFSIHADTEIARSDRVMFRTSLTDYERVRLRARYQIKPSLLAYGAWHYLNNSNPVSLNPFELRHQQTAFGLQWLPKAGKSTQVLGEYSRSTLRSDLNYFAPQMLSPERSLYRENAHTITGMVNLFLPAGWTWHPKLSLGGSAFWAAGSRPMNFYQPVVRFQAPATAHVDFFAEYRWYGISQAFYVYEGFRSHQGIVGLRIH